MESSGNPFNRIKSSVNRGIATISLKTSSSVEKSKLKTHIESLQNEINETIKSIGEKTYKIWQEDTDDFDEINELCERVSVMQKEINELISQISAINDKENAILGNKADDGVICPNCGMEYNSKVNFCRKCGYKIGCGN